MATKNDLKQTETYLATQIKSLDIQANEIKSELKNDMTQLEYRLIIRLSTIVGAMITLAIAVTAAVAKLI